MSGNTLAEAPARDSAASEIAFDTEVCVKSFVDPAHPGSWSRQLTALLDAGHYHEGYALLSEKVPYVCNQLRPYAEHLAGKVNYWTHTHAWLARLLDLRRPQRILDVGCSVGGHAIELARGGHQTCGLDILPAMIERGRELAASLGLAQRVQLVTGDIRTPQSYFEAASFDAAVACDIFEHLDDDALLSVLGGLRQVVRPGGRLAVQTSPGKYYYWFEPDRRKLLALLAPLAWLPDAAFTSYVHILDRLYIQGARREPVSFYRQEPGHINCMDAGHLGRLLRQAGFADVRTFAVHAHPGFKDEGCRRADWTRYLFGRKSIAARNVFGVATIPETGARA